MARTLLPVGLALLLCPCSLRAQSPETHATLGVDWTADTITVMGVGQPPPNPTNLAQARAITIRAALNDAARGLNDLLRGIVIQGGLTVGELVEANEAVRARVEGLVKGAWQAGPPTYRSDGSIELTVFVRRSEVAAAVLPDMGFATTMPQGPAPAGIYSGLVVDARGTGLSPSLICRVLDEKGQEVYGPALVTRDFAIRNGVTGFSREIGKGDRVGSHPLQVRAIVPTGKARSDVTVSSEDGDRVRSASQAWNFLGQGRVLILID